jgi:hypothetical protein
MWQHGSNTEKELHERRSECDILDRLQKPFEEMDTRKQISWNRKKQR